MIRLIKIFLRFVSVGAIGTGGHYSTLILMVEIGKIDPVISSATGFVVGALINYILNYYLTFRSRRNHFTTMAKFFLIATITGGINVGMVYIAIDRAHLNYLIAQIFATGTVLILNFLANLCWTFKKIEEYKR